jgi:hypothetical protein
MWYICSYNLIKNSNVSVILHKSIKSSVLDLGLVKFVIIFSEIGIPSKALKM